MSVDDVPHLFYRYGKWCIGYSLYTPHEKIKQARRKLTSLGLKYRLVPMIIYRPGFVRVKS